MMNEIKILNKDRIQLVLAWPSLILQDRSYKRGPSAYGIRWFSWIQFRLIPWAIFSLPLSQIYQKFNEGTKSTISNTRNYTWRSNMPGSLTYWLHPYL